MHLFICGFCSVDLLIIIYAGTYRGYVNRDRTFVKQSILTHGATTKVQHKTLSHNSPPQKKQQQQKQKTKLKSVPLNM